MPFECVYYMSFIHAHNELHIAVPLSLLSLFFHLLFVYTEKGGWMDYHLVCFVGLWYTCPSKLLNFIWLYDRSHVCMYVGIDRSTFFIHIVVPPSMLPTTNQPVHHVTFCLLVVVLFISHGLWLILIVIVKPLEKCPCTRMNLIDFGI
jgi:hypothetical protein